jgi:hypothetical protein
MDKRIMTVGAALTLALIFPLPAHLFAEQIEHHGIRVEAEAKAEGCLSCHDGSVGHFVSSCTVKCDFSTSHSILKHYPPRGRERDYAPGAAILAKGIRLENGKVTCLSCHNLRNPKKNHMVVDVSKTDLCKICHIKK